MATTEITQDNIEETLQSDGIVLLDWWAEWCGPCKQFGPIFESASEKHPDVLFGKIDTESQQELAGAAGISSIPTLMAFRGGIMVFQQPGALPKQALEEVITAVKDLDMDEVHKQVAAQKAASGAPDSQ